MLRKLKCLSNSSKASDNKILCLQPWFENSINPIRAGGGWRSPPLDIFLSRFRYDCDSLFKFLHKKLLRITQLLKKNLGRYHHYRGYCDVIISKSLKFRVSDFSGVIRFFCVFCNFRPIYRPKSKKRANSFGNFRELSTQISNFSSISWKMTKWWIFQFWKVKNSKISIFVKNQGKNVRFLGNKKW